MTRHATEYGAYEVTPLPGQPQVAVCHGFMVPQDMRGRGYGHMLKAHQGATLRAQLHDFAICTVAAGNAAQQRVLEAAGWKKLAYLKSRCRIDPKTECWEWANCIQGNGYGRVRVGAKTRYAHRLAWELAHGQIPKGRDVCHHCDNRRCINPEHLFIGTRLQNMRDAQQKGRLSTGIRHSLTVTGHVRARAKLSLEVAREIRRLRADGQRAVDLAQRFGVDASNIRAIIANKTWREPTWFNLR